MKKIYIIASFIASMFLVSSCTSYLDISPESGLSEKDVFTKYVNMKAFADVAYSGKDKRNIQTAFPLFWMQWDQKTGLNATTDIADNGRLFWAQPVKRGIMQGSISMMTYDDVRRPVFDAMLKSIRVANITLQNVDRVTDAPAQSDIEDLRGQAYFARAYAHFILVCYWGPFPHLDKPMGADDEWDVPRLEVNDILNKVAEDLDLAYAAFEKAGKVRRDPAPGNPGHLEDPLQGRPSGVAAKALKSRVLLYAASKKNNKNGLEDWKKAATAAAEALQIALDYKYSLVPMDKYYTNFYDEKYSNEQIWAWHKGKLPLTGTDPQGMISGVFLNNKSYASGEMPTQNMVDMYETKWGEPLNTEADRNAAIAKGHYDDQNPYENRDPRFYNNVIYNMAPITWKKVKNDEYPDKANMYYTNKNGKIEYATHISRDYKGTSYTGYYARKYAGDYSYQNNVGRIITDPLIRLAELYLNYAEAVNEASGPTGTAGSMNLTAIDAINVIRNRAEMPDLKQEYTANSDVFRERLYNERTVEFDQEGFHRYHDIRRWMIAPQVMNATLYGMDIEKTGDMQFKYTRVPLPDDRQVKWFDYMYYFPFDTNDYFKFKIFDTSLNPVW